MKDEKQIYSRICELRAENKRYEKELKEKQKPFKKEINDTQKKIAALKTTMKNSIQPKTIQRYIKEIEILTEKYKKLIEPTADIQFCIDENEYCINLLLIELISETPIELTRLMDNIMNETFLLVLEYVIYLKTKKHRDQWSIEKCREAEESLEWIIQDIDCNYYDPKKIKTKDKNGIESMTETYSGPYTFGYLCDCLGYDSLQIQKIFINIKKKSLSNLNKIVKLYQNTVKS
jgi:hypothetical protein